MDLCICSNYIKIGMGLIIIKFRIVFVFGREEDVLDSGGVYRSF